MGNRFYAGMPDYIEKLNAFDDQLNAAGGPVNPIFNSVTGKWVVKDTRGVSKLPTNYLDGIAGVTAEFKESNEVGFPPVQYNPGYQCCVVTYAAWIDQSGGVPVQLSLGDGMAVRRATSLNTWGDWRKVLTDSAAYPTTDNTFALGAAWSSWTVLYAKTGAIQTSDARQKTPIERFTQNEREAARALAKEIGRYQWLSSIAEKGVDSARQHIGLTVQRAIEIMRGHGLDPMRYAFICHDRWDAEYQEVACSEKDLGSYKVIVQAQKMRVQTKTREHIQIVDGKAVLVVDEYDHAEPVFEYLPVTFSDGSPVVSDGQQVLHPVPVIESVEQWMKRIETKPAGDRYAFRYDQLALFILSGLVQDPEPVAA